MLDRGDGVCTYFDDVTKLCTIYENRPIICNIDKMYDSFLQGELSRDAYYKLNYEACKKLKEMELEN